MEITAIAYGIELLPKGKIHYYCENGEEISVGDLVLVMTEFGIDVGKVMIGPREMNIEQIGAELKPIIRKLTQEDLKEHTKNVEDSKKALELCKKKVKEHQLPMTMLYARYMFDRSRLVFYFSSETRVDFRELVKDLAKIFRTRIELRQVGVRDELKLIGGLGLCGQETCCSRFLREFGSVTLKHAKSQQMMINTAKISGACRRLLCCLMYEYDFYVEELKGVPNEGSVVEYEGKTFKVQTVDVFRKTVSLFSDEGGFVVLPFSHFRKDEDATDR